MQDASSLTPIASLRDWLNPPPPHELLVTRTLTPCCFSAVTLSNARTGSEMNPLPFESIESMNLSDMSWTLQLIPAMAIPLLAR